MNSFFIVALVIVGSSGLLEAGHIENQPETQPIGEEYGIRADWDFSQDSGNTEQTLDPKCSLGSLQQLADTWKAASLGDAQVSNEIKRDALETVEMCVQSLLISRRNSGHKYVHDQIRPSILAAKSCSDKVGWSDFVPQIGTDKLVNGVVDYLISKGDITVSDYKKKLFADTDKRFPELRQLLKDKVTYKYHSSLEVTESDKILSKILELVDSMQIEPIEKIKEELIDYRICSVLKSFLEVNDKLTMSAYKQSGEPFAMFDSFAEAVFKELKRRANGGPVIC